MSTNQLVPDSSTFEISNNAMNLANLGVTNSKIADNTITGSKITSHTIDNTKILGLPTVNTIDSWVPVMHGNELQYRVIKPFNADGSIPSSAIANNAIKSTNIDWATLRYRFTATSDSKGFFEIPTSVVKPTTGFIISARLVGAVDGFLLLYNDETLNKRYTLRYMLFDFTPITGTKRDIDILYCLNPQ